MAFLTIHSPPGLSPESAERAADLGPSFVRGMESPEHLLREAGFDRVSVTDVTTRFRTTCLAWGAAFDKLDAPLRAELGDEDYEGEVDRKDAMLAGIDEGLLVRSLVTGWRDCGAGL